MDRFPDQIDPDLSRELALPDRLVPPSWGDPPIRDARQTVRAARVRPDDPPQRAREKIIAVYARHLQAVGQKMRHTGVTLDAYVNHGRWVARCTVCNGGIPVWPDWDQGCCPDCGAVYTIAFPAPDSVVAASEALGLRERANRNWFPEDETPEDLVNENRMRGIE